jgi:hypothetical protein
MHICLPSVEITSEFADFRQHGTRCMYDVVLSTRPRACCFPPWLPVTSRM